MQRGKSVANQHFYPRKICVLKIIRKENARLSVMDSGMIYVPIISGADAQAVLDLSDAFEQFEATGEASSKRETRNI